MRRAKLVLYSGYPEDRGWLRKRRKLPKGSVQLFYTILPVWKARSAFILRFNLVKESQSRETRVDIYRTKNTASSESANMRRFLCETQRERKQGM